LCVGHRADSPPAWMRVVTPTRVCAITASKAGVSPHGLRWNGRPVSLHGRPVPSARRAGSSAGVVSRSICAGCDSVHGWEWTVMARAIWTGVITFGMVSVPVGLYTAIENHTVHFHQLQRGTADRIRNRRVNERTGKEVKAEDIVKGFEVTEGEYVIIEPDELEEIAPGRSRTIDISDFVDLADIEPVYFERTYYIAPRGKEYTKVCQLLRAALEESGKAGIATFVMRAKQYLTALRTGGDHLFLACGIP
jgi:hypothetical protein